MVGEQKDELHEHVPSPENSVVKGGVHSSAHVHESNLLAMTKPACLI